MLATASGAYEAAVLADAPLGFWRFNETSGTTAADTSGNNHGGTYVGSPVLGGPGPISAESPNTAVSLNGAGQKVTLPLLATPATIEAWVRLPSPNLGTLPVYSNRDSATRRRSRWSSSE